MPAYDFLSGVASAVEKQSNALQAYGLQKREQEREQQERTQYNQVFTELGQFLASGQEIPEERIQTWTNMMGAAPPEIVTAFTNAMNTLGNRREEQQYRATQNEIAQETLKIQRGNFDINKIESAANIQYRIDKMLQDRALAEAQMRSNEKIAGLSRERQNDITDRLISLVSSSGAAGEFDPNSLVGLLNEVLAKKGFTQRVTIDQGLGRTKTPQEYIDEAAMSIGADRVNKTLLIQWLINKHNQSRASGNNVEAGAIETAISLVNSLPDDQVSNQREEMSKAWGIPDTTGTRGIRR